MLAEIFFGRKSGGLHLLQISAGYRLLDGDAVRWSHVSHRQLVPRIASHRATDGVGVATHQDNQYDLQPRLIHVRGKPSQARAVFRA